MKQLFIILFTLLSIFTFILPIQANVQKSEMQIGLDSDNIFNASIRLVPLVENKKLIGFEVFTVNQNSIFNSINLLPKDIITHVNQTKLTSQNVRGLVKMLGKSNSGSYTKIKSDKNYQTIETQIKFKINKEVELEKTTRIKYNVPYFSNQIDDYKKVSISNTRNWRRFEVDKVEKINLTESDIDKIDGFKLILEEDYILSDPESSIKSFDYLDDFSPLRKLGLKAFDRILAINSHLLDEPLSKDEISKIDLKKPITFLVERYQELIRFEITPKTEDVLSRRQDLKKDLLNKLNQIFFPSSELLAKLKKANSNKSGDVFEELYFKTFLESSLEKYISKNIDVKIPLKQAVHTEKLAQDILSQILAIPVFRKNSIMGYKIIRVGKDNFLKTLKIEDNDILITMNDIKVYKDDEFFRDIIGSLKHNRKGYLIVRRKDKLVRIRYSLD